MQGLVQLIACRSAQCYYTSRSVLFALADKLNGLYKPLQSSSLLSPWKSVFRVFNPSLVTSQLQTLILPEHEDIFLVWLVAVASSIGRFLLGDLPFVYLNKDPTFYAIDPPYGNLTTHPVPRTQIGRRPSSGN